MNKMLIPAHPLWRRIERLCPEVSPEDDRPRGPLCCRRRSRALGIRTFYAPFLFTGSFLFIQSCIPLYSIFCDFLPHIELFLIHYSTPSTIFTPFLGASGMDSVRHSGPGASGEEVLQRFTAGERWRCGPATPSFPNKFCNTADESGDVLRTAGTMADGGGGVPSTANIPLSANICFFKILKNSRHHFCRIRIGQSFSPAKNL